VGSGGAASKGMFKHIHQIRRLNWIKQNHHWVSEDWLLIVSSSSGLAQEKRPVARMYAGKRGEFPHLRVHSLPFVIGGVGGSPLPD